MTPLRLALAVLLVLSVLAGCSDDDGDGDGGNGTTSDATIQPPATTTTADLASGSGCTPTSVDGLPDGRWFGFVTDLDETDTGPDEGPPPDVLTFDLACWFDGEAATAAAAEDGAESPPPNDYHTRNDNPLVRQLPLESDVEVRWLADIGDPSSMGSIDLADWRTRRSGVADRPWVWIEITDGLVVMIEEQYVP